MNALPWLIALSVGLAVLGTGGLVAAYFAQAQQRLARQRRLDRLDRRLAGGTDFDPGSEAQPPLERLALFLTGRLHADADPAARDSEDRLLLVRAGFRSLRALLAFQALRLALPVGAVLLTSGYALFAGSPGVLVKAFATGAVAYLAPKHVLAWLAQRRCRQLADEIPMFVDYLRMMHSVGISFEQSLLLFADDHRAGLPVLAGEFRAVNLAIRSGRARADALKQMAGQLDIAELSELVALIAQTERYGAGIQEPLRAFSQRLSEKKRFALQEYVGRMANKMVVVMVLFLLPALLIVTAGPGFISVAKALANIV